MKKDMNKLSNRIASSYKMLGILGVVCLMVFVILSAKNYYDFRDKLVYKEQMQLLTIAETTAKSLTSFVDEKVEDMRILKQLIRENIILSDNAQTMERIPIVMENYFEVQKDEISALELIDQSGRVLYLATEMSNDPFEGYEKIPNADHQEKVSEVQEDKNHEYFIIIRETISMKDGNVAYLLMRINLEKMYDLLIKDIRAGEKGYASVKDSEGILLMHPKKEDIGANVMVARKSEYPEYDWSELEYLVNLQKDGEAGVGIYHSIWYHDEKRERIKKFSAFAPSYVGKEFWTITVSMDYIELVGIINKHYYRSMTLMGLIAGFLAILSLVMLNLKRNLRQLEIEHEYVEELNRLNKELDQNQRKYKRLFNTGSHLSFVTSAPTVEDESLSILEANDFACERLGIERSNIISMSYHSFDTSLEYEALSDIITSTIDKDHVQYETELIGYNKHKFPVEIYVNRFKIDNKYFLMFNARDITEKKASEETLETNRGIMIYKSRLAAMGEMIANIAHQWRQPLSRLNLMISNIEDAYDFNDLNENYFKEQIEKSQVIIQDMSTVIDDFRYFFDPKDQKKFFEPQAQIKSALEMLNDRIQINEVEIQVFENNKLDLFGYSSQFSQVILNIINNSIDALKLVEKNRLIKIFIEYKGTNIELKIVDNGGGVSEENIPKLFDPYFTTKDKDAGTGIGLYMTRLIIERNFNGKIEVSNIENGLMTSINIPIKGE